MELYILDVLLRRHVVVDEFKSLVWTERWQAYGEFVLDIQSTTKTRAQFSLGTFLALEPSLSLRIMVVESVEDRTDDEGRDMLQVKGRSLEGLIMTNRIVKTEMAPLVLDSSELYFGSPHGIAKIMFHNTCGPGDNVLSVHDKIPYLQNGTNFPLGNIPPHSGTITWYQEPDILYNAIRKLCESYNLGFRILRNIELPQLFFEVYFGNDLRESQDIMTPMVFGSNLEMVKSPTELKSIQDYKNVAYVFSEEYHAITYADGVSPSISGFDRRIMTLTVRLDPEDSGGTDTLIARGREALRAQAPKSIFDAEINPDGEYKYGVDYNLGDLVSLYTRDVEHVERRVVEQIFTFDETGFHSYPTLAKGEIE